MQDNQHEDTGKQIKNKILKTVNNLKKYKPQFHNQSV